MNAIPYFDYSLAPFWPSYQSKVIGVLERALREQSGSRVRRILLRLPCEYDTTFSSRKTWFGMAFNESEWTQTSSDRRNFAKYQIQRT
ncbi:hypothetical protein AT418_004467, partial [Escherichia coli]